MENDNLYVTLNFPARMGGSMTGSQFAASILEMPAEDPRELAILQQFQLGNVPNFMRTLHPIRVSSTGAANARCSCTYWVTPDYLCIGTDDDYVRVPMSPLTATKIADMVGGSLITRRMVNSIFEAASTQLVAKPKSHSGPMMSTAYFRDHNTTIQAQLDAVNALPGELVAGHKKDVVLCRALFDGKPYPAGHSDRVAIYGWAQLIQNRKWTVWQGLNPESHENTYKDYSHGIRLVAQSLMVNGTNMPYEEVLTDPVLAGAVSDEGALEDSRYPNT